MAPAFQAPGPAAFAIQETRTATVSVPASSLARFAWRPLLRLPAITVSPMQIWGVAHRIESPEEGKLADLVTDRGPWKLK